MKIEDFGPFKLSEGEHSGPSDGMCVMEMTSFLAGDEWSDMPECASPVVSKFCQVINDEMGQDVRDRLQSYVPRLIGTASPQHDYERAEYLAWAAVRVFAPIGLRGVGNLDAAARLESFDGSLQLAYELCLDECSLGAYYCVRALLFEPNYNLKWVARDAAVAAIESSMDMFDETVEAVFKVLDGLLEIGPSGGELMPEQAARIEPLRVAIANKEDTLTSG